MARRRSDLRVRTRVLQAMALLGVSTLFHAGLIALLAVVFGPRWSAPIPPEGSDRSSDEPLDVTVLDALPGQIEPLPDDDAVADGEETVEVEVMPPRVDGQVVDLPPPRVEEEPERAQYLAEHSRKVEEETRSERYKVNPEVLAETFSETSRLQLEDVVDLGFDEPSTGARVGGISLDPKQDDGPAPGPAGSMFAITNKEGLDRPVPASHGKQDLAGAPANDYLDEKVGAGVNLNTHAFLYANYINRIKRLVSFYWQQQIDNLPAGLPLSRSRYETVVAVDLTPDGTVADVRVVEPCGSTPLDNAVLEAFRMAGPFPNPPQGLVGPDGMARLSDMAFHLEVGHARALYQGVDPRAGVQFPGILKARQ
ncbi:MAG: TonB C-terminal domain-containing protein [Deltaproteobacteria bacterium]|nr:TonB C-terminal domain-containing protein [Deltaproteobacteria bacterium]